MNVAVPSAVEGETMSVCPCGGHHDFQTVKDNDFWAGLGAGACGTCLFCVWWPLLLCAPLCYFGGREISKDLSDRVCTKCLVRIDRQGSIKEQPLNVPEVNPVTGQLNTVYGWVQPGKGGAQQGGFQQAAWVPQPREGGGEGDTSKTD